MQISEELNIPAWGPEDLRGGTQTQRKKGGPAGASEGKGQPTPPVIHWVHGSGENFRSPTPSSQIPFPEVVEAKWKQKRVKGGLAAPFCSWLPS